MPREFVIFSAEPIGVLECVAATAAVDPDLGIGRWWNGGATQIASDTPVLAVLRSASVTADFDVERMAGRSIPAGTAWLTEAYAPFGEELTLPVVTRLADDVGGTLVELGVDG